MHRARMPSVSPRKKGQKFLVFAAALPRSVVVEGTFQVSLANIHSIPRRFPTICPLDHSLASLHLDLEVGVCWLCVYPLGHEDPGGFVWQLVRGSFRSFRACVRDVLVIIVPNEFGD